MDVRRRVSSAGSSSRGRACIVGISMLALLVLSMQAGLFVPALQEINQVINQAKHSKDADPAPRASMDHTVCTQNPYADSLNKSLSDIAVMADKWLDSMPQHYERANGKDMTNHNHERFFPFEPMSSCQQSCVGGRCGADTSKIACGIDSLKEGCVIYSIGGNNQWAFELDLLEKTPCEVHTFDCTGPASRFKKPQNDRLKFHHVCLGEKPAPVPSECVRGDICGEVMTIEGMQEMLGHKQIDLLKMDIEGFEWPIFQSWPTLLIATDLVLPFQILVEVHYQTQFPVLFKGTGLPFNEFGDWRFAKDVVKLQEHLLRMGYVTVIRDDNVACPHCTELTFVRFRCPSTSLMQAGLVIPEVQEVKTNEHVMNQANHLKDANPAPRASTDQNAGTVCAQNPYADSLNKSLSDIAVMADKWLDSMPQHYERANGKDMTNHNHERFFPFEPMSSCQQSCVGGRCGADTSKIACGIDSLKEGCVIYSIGGNNQWAFELDLLEKTPCEVHTFDCTGPTSRFKKPQNDRLKFHHVCLGEKPAPVPSECVRGDICGEVMTIEGMQEMLGHKRIDLLKMDIEGFEWPIFQSWPTLLNATDLVLPFQILVEVHYQTQFPVLFEGTGLPNNEFGDWRFAKDVVKLQEHLLQMGYATVIRDDNVACPHCAELTLVRFRCP